MTTREHIEAARKHAQDLTDAIAKGLPTHLVLSELLKELDKALDSL